MNKKRMETSKKIILVSGIFFAVAVIYTIISCSIAMIYSSYVDWTSIVTLLTVAGGAFGTACGFYFNKAKSENNYKLRMAFLREKYAILKEMGKLSAEERPEMGKIANEVREAIENEINTNYDNQRFTTGSNLELFLRYHPDSSSIKERRKNHRLFIELCQRA